MKDLILTALRNSKDPFIDKSLYVDSEFPIVSPDKNLLDMRKAMGLETKNIRDYSLIAWMMALQSNYLLCKLLYGDMLDFRVSFSNYLPRESILQNAEVLNFKLRGMQELLEEPKTIPFDTEFILTVSPDDKVMYVNGNSRSYTLPCDKKYITTETRGGWQISTAWGKCDFPLKVDLFIPALPTYPAAPPIFFYYVPPSFPYNYVINTLEESSYFDVLLSNNQFTELYYGQNSDIGKASVIAATCFSETLRQLSK